jgi:hypothetical protein
VQSRQALNDRPRRAGRGEQPEPKTGVEIRNALFFGTSGSAWERLWVAVASGLSLPAAIWPITVEAGENVASARPAITSVTVCGLP